MVAADSPAPPAAATRRARDAPRRPATRADWLFEGTMWTIPKWDSGGYPAGMIGSFNPVQFLSLTFVTSSLIIQGSVRTRLQRLTDVMNEPDMDHLVLFEATFMEPGSRRIVASASVSQIQLEDMLFVHASGPTESGQELRTPKQPTRAILLAPPYTIEGQIHLPMEEELQQAVDSLRDRFLPVTNAKYWAYGVAESPIEVDVLVVNRARAHVAIPVGTEWRKAGPPEVRSRGGQNPW